MAIFENLKDWIGMSPKPASGSSRAAAVKSTVSKVTPIRNYRSGSDTHEIVTLNPTSFDSVKEIADAFCSDVTVVVNMLDLSEKDSVRVRDFMLGLKEGRDGNLKRVTPKVFLLTPHNMIVNQGDEEEETEETVS